MNTFEAVRTLAECLHHQLVAAGADPLRPGSLVEQAIRHFSYELTYLEPDDPALKGARALFDGQSGTICCENVGTASDRIQLIAHEIGHAVIHKGSSSCHASDVEVSRSVEAAPVGLQKVEDYGTRERRELEANVFAREFLFPRSVARRLHAVETRSAIDIARTLDLPLPLTRQQILDALLLPEFPVAQEPAAPPASFEPDPAQDVAADYRNAPYQLRAGPGTGKTRTLVKRIQSLLAENVQPSAILVLTFSNRTAGELSERLDKAFPDGTAGMWVGTFHGFGLDLVRRFHEKLGLPPDPILFDRSDAIAVLEEILPTLDLRHYRNLWDPVVVLREILNAISRAKDELAGPERYHELATAMKARAGDDEDKLIAAEKCLEVAKIYALYEAEKRTRGAIDFGDLIMVPALLLQSDPAVAAAVRLRHRHVLVDEYQDVNRASVELVKGIAGDGKKLWVVGDARQSIYRFRGASAANMAAFEAEFPGAVAGPLTVSYRSTQKVIDTFSRFASAMALPAALRSLTLRANRGPGQHIPDVRAFPTPDQEEGGIAASIKELEAKGASLRDQAVLCRTNTRLNEIARALEDRGIPVLHLGSLFERDEVRDLLAILSLATDRYGSGLVRVAAMPRYRMPLQDVKRLLDQLKDDDGPALARLAELRTMPGLSTSAVSAVERLCRDLDGLKPSQSPRDLLTTLLLDRTDLVRQMAIGTAIGDRMRAIAVWQFLNFLREQSPVARGSPIQTLLDRVRNLVLLAEERDLRQVPDAALQMDAVRLMTIHGSKGLEFEAVHIPGLTVMSVPGRYQGTRCPPPEGLIAGSTAPVADETKAAHAQEEECLFFVAMSRARTHLRLYRAETQKNGNGRTVSPYLQRLAGSISSVASPTSLPLPPDVRSPEPIRLTISAEWLRTHDRIASYGNCARRFFYTHVLGIGAARRTTPFTRTHDCIYELIDWLAQERLSRPPTVEEAHAAFATNWDARGPLDHAFADQYRDLAFRLVADLVTSGAGRRFREAQPLAVDFKNGTVIVEPDEIAERSDGVIAIRRIRTGHRGDSEFDKLEYLLFQRAAEIHYGPSAVVEAVHLTDNAVEDVPRLTARKAATRAETTETILSGITAGMFDPDPDQFGCPRCPHFFICAATPEGPLSI